MDRDQREESPAGLEVHNLLIWRRRWCPRFVIIIINLFIEGSLISAKAQFCLRTLFCTTRINSYTRMASFIRTRLSKYVCDEKNALWARKPLGTAVPQDETFLLVPCRGLEPPTYHTWGVNID